MSERSHLDKPPIEPAYKQSKPNEQLNLGNILVDFTYEGNTYEETAEVLMHFLPNDRLIFTVPENSKPLWGLGFKMIMDSWEGKLKLKDRGVDVDVFCISCENNKVIFQSKHTPITASQYSTEISSALIHLFNFPNFLGPDDFILHSKTETCDSSQRCGRIKLEADGWVIDIVATEQTADMCKLLKAKGGYAITHIGLIKRSDLAVFSSEQLEKLMFCLQQFLSFALGCDAGVGLSFGFDKTGKRVFEQWGLPRVKSGPWDGLNSWFNMRHGELLQQVFPGFATLWNDEIWIPALRKGLYWYLRANGLGSGMDTGLILAQTALEHLAWTHCVRHRKIISKEAFEPRGLSAADKLRLLASSLNIPLDIPDDLKALNANPGKKWDDAMDAITSIRNSLVHPNKDKEIYIETAYEAWKLSMWYIDMVLLRLCGHNGGYANRFIMSSSRMLEPVPWAKK